MLTSQKGTLYKKIMLAASLVSFLVWILIGSGISIAWFSDTTPEVRNIFHFADFDLDVSYRRDGDPTWKPLEGETKVFDDEALYEPNYTQVIFLKVDNKGDKPFNFKTAVTVFDYTVATNVYGQNFNLQDYLTFGLSPASTETAMENAVSTRDKAITLANQPLSNYSTDEALLAEGETAYIALVVHMPKDVGNAANYRGSTIPKVELGITVSASQITA